jgi:hypothetical protein
MTHVEGEAKVKGLQKEFLSWVESNDNLRSLSPEQFNTLRRKAFSSTFEAFRLGVVGLGEPAPDALWGKFFGWASIPGLTQDTELEIQAKCFRTSLEAFRVGAMVVKDN